MHIRDPYWELSILLPVHRVIDFPLIAVQSSVLILKDLLHLNSLMEAIILPGSSLGSFSAWIELNCIGPQAYSFTHSLHQQTLEIQVDVNIAGSSPLI